MIDFCTDVLGVRLMPWQRWLFIHALELNKTGTGFRFRIVVVLIARQNGKTAWVQMLALWRMFVDCARLVIGTAQNLDVAEEAWSGAVDMVESIPELRAELAAVDRVNGKKAIRLIGGERYKVAAASRRGGRGLSGDLVVLDELREHQHWEAWAAVTKTTMARRGAQIVCLSNAGDARSVVLAHQREVALRGITSGRPTVGLFEWSAPDGCPVDDRDGWAAANPALGHTIDEEAVLSAIDDPEPIFRTEVLCQWVTALAPPQIDPDAWAQLAGQPVTTGGEHTYFVDVDTTDGATTGSIAAAASAGGRPHVKLVEHRPGAEWLPRRIAELADQDRGARWALLHSGEAGTLLPQIERAGVHVDEWSTTEMGRACAHLRGLVRDGNVTHDGDQLVAEALLAAQPRPVGEDLWVWSRRRSTSDIGPLMAVTGALWLLERKPAYTVAESIW